MPVVTPGAASPTLKGGTPVARIGRIVAPAAQTFHITTGTPTVQTSTTVFTLAGYFDLIPGAIDVNYQLQGKIVANYPVINVAWPNFGLDAAFIALGPNLYPSDQLTSINTGRDNLNTALLAQSGRKVILAHSGGAVVASKWLHDLGNASTIPVADLLFVFIGNSVRRYGGVLYHDEYGVPVDTKYQVIDIARQYDGWCDWPTETDNENFLLAEMNAMTGATWVHPWYQQVDPFDTTMPSFQEGNITYLLSPTRPWWQPDYAVPFIEQAYNRPETAPSTALVVEPPTNSSPLVKRYPQGPITHHGALMLLNGSVPMMCYRAYDDTIKFDIAGPLAIPDRTMPECVRLKGLKGLIPPWQNVSQKGATDDGEHYVTSLYDPADVDLTVEFKGRDYAHKRELVRDWISAWDAKKPGELSFTDTNYPSTGRWWSKVRWAKNPADPETLTRVAKYTWPAKAYDSFWRSYDSVAEFRPSLAASVIEDFNVSSSVDWGLNWALNYYGGGAANTGTVDGQAVWFTSGTQMKGVVARRVGFTTTTDYQVVEMVLGSLPQTFFVDQAYDDVWCRLANTGTPGDTGVRLRIGIGFIELAYFVGGVKTVLRQDTLWIPPQPGERWTIVAGTPPNTATGVVDAPRQFTVQRNGIAAMTVQELGTGSQLGAAFRSAGAGMEAGAGWFNQAVPGSLLKWNAGDNANITAEGWLDRYNLGDQDMWDRFTIYGPAQLVEIGNGPGETDDMIAFGPVFDGQAMQIRTQPGKRGVVDLTNQPVTVAPTSLYAAALADFLDHAMGGNVTPLEQSIANGFGQQTVQGNPYSLLKGRFSKPIPAKPAAGLPPKYQVKVRITGGNAHTSVAVAGTPLRRYPH